MLFKMDIWFNYCSASNCHSSFVSPANNAGQFKGSTASIQSSIFEQKKNEAKQPVLEHSSKQTRLRCWTLMGRFLGMVLLTALKGELDLPWMIVQKQHVLLRQEKQTSWIICPEPAPQPSEWKQTLIKQKGLNHKGNTHHRQTQTVQVWAIRHTLTWHISESIFSCMKSQNT